MIDALGIFRRDAETTVALIEITTASHKLKILRVITIIAPPWTATTTRAITFLELIAGAHLHQWTGGVLGGLVSARCVNGKAIRCPPQQEHLIRFFTAQLLHQATRQAMIMIGPVRLHMRLILIQPQIDLAAFGFSHPP